MSFCAALLLSTLISAFAAISSVSAQQASDSSAPQTAQPAPAAKPKKPPKPYGGGTPLDVLLSSKLWVDPPKQQEFVRETREPSSALHYQPTVGTDPQRPPLLSKDKLQALQQELEQGGAVNEKAAEVKQRNFADVALPTPAPKVKPRKEKTKKLSTGSGPLQLH